MSYETEFELLKACEQMLGRQKELATELARVLGLGPEELFYAWAERRCRQHGDLESNGWSFFFHGLECDLNNRLDGRFLRIDFGPGGRLDTFTAWRVLQFIMASRPPWPEFAELKRLLAKTEPPYDRHSGSLGRAVAWLQRLETLGLIGSADPDLSRFAEEHTRVNPQGVQVLSVPPEAPERLLFDMSVCHRKVISDKGRQMLAEIAAPPARQPIIVA